MTLTLFTDYSLRILMYAAMRGRNQFSVDDVAEAYGLSRNHVAKAVNFLAHHGYLEARRGRGGGISLGKPATEICIGAVVRQTETGPPLIECFDAATNTCPIIRACVLKRALAEAWNAFFAVLDGYTLADLVRKPALLANTLALQA
ncbi:MAG: Rrf2 family transcriptional regulator [Verrucomicrobiota bacterium]